uniref:sugar transferase n=1 Tax=Methylobacterium sp. TaxID=409 RepID=UPI002674CD22|nr:sugar transferase [Methylobacterium sp.]
MITEISSSLRVGSDSQQLLPQVASHGLPVPTCRPVVNDKPLGGSRKRFFDVCLASMALLALLPLFILVAIAVKASDRGPVFFRHRRVGTSGTAFDCLKFRTMRPDSGKLLEMHLQTDAQAQAEFHATRKLKNDPRITVIGSYLRKSSLDELPQLLNIITGEMSIVGPRPVVTDELALYGSDARHYYATRPGLTGAWQVSGRNDVSYEERVRLDRDYVENWSFATDLQIIARTIPAVFMSRGSY